MATTMEVKANESSYNLYHTLTCNWNKQNHCTLVSSDEDVTAGEEEEELQTLQKELETDIVEHFSKVVGWNLVEYGRIHIIGFSQEQADKLRLREKSKQRQKVEKLTDMAKLIATTRGGLVQSKICQSPMIKLRLSDIVETICPPREWQSRGVKMTQYVSCRLPTRRDTIAMKDKVDQQIKLRKETMTEDGMCPERRQLIASLFDELIRQVTVNCVERGQLLLKIRDEMYSTFNSYETLFNSLIAHGINKIMASKKNMDDIKANIEMTTIEIEDLENIKAESESAYTFFETKFETEDILARHVFEAKEERLVKINLALKDLLLTVVQKGPNRDDPIDFEAIKMI